MQAKSIPEPARLENERLPFPVTGDNFQTIACLEGVADPLALLEALALLEDVKIVWCLFQAEQDRIGTVKTD
ncbi:MAG: hypothetical protein E6Q85_06005 [Thiothrix sp.]|nr:MAG: hypothetical protein E6Q85_06005 [Thiothrix sp.]